MTLSTLNEQLERYSTALDRIHQADPETLTLVDRLEPLLARDAIEAALKGEGSVTAQNLEQLLQLDRQFRSQVHRIFCEPEIHTCRDQLCPPDSAWWWFLEVEAPRPPAYLTQLDGLWKLGAAACLALAATFMTKTVQAFSTQGFDVLGTMGTITQGAGLVVVAQGTLTDQGKDRLHRSLNDLGVPQSWHEEVTFMIAVGLLVLSYGLHQNLYRFSDYYYHLGQRQEAAQEWSNAKKSYARALDFNSGNDQALFGLGMLAEKLGEHQEAADIYHQGIPNGDPQFYNALGRSRLRHALESNGWLGRIDRPVLSDVLSLLNRAKQAAEIGRQSSSTIDTDQLSLATDILINLGIAHWAAVDLNTLRRNPEDDRTLFIAENWFSEAHKIEDQKITRWEQQQILEWRQALAASAKDTQTPVDPQAQANLITEKLLTVRLPWNLLRSQCLQAAAEAVLVATRASRSSFPGALYTEGLDPRLVNDNVGFSCHELLQATGDVDAASDAMLLSALLSSKRVLPLNNSRANETRFLQEVDPTAHIPHQSRLESRLNDYIQDNQWNGTTRMPLVNRVLVDAQDNIVGVYAYDYFSIVNLENTPPFLLAQTQTRSTVGEPIADFWVRFKTFGKFEIEPWHRRYAVDQGLSSTANHPKGKNLSKSGEMPNFGELAILRALVYTQLRNQVNPLRSDPGNWIPSFERKLIYNVFVAADGRIVGYAPAPYNNNEAEQKVRSTPLRAFPQDDQHNEAVAYFFLTFKSSDSFQLDSGSCLANPTSWDIPETLRLE